MVLFYSFQPMNKILNLLPSVGKADDCRGIHLQVTFYRATLKCFAFFVLHTFLYINLWIDTGV
jgi:hypothetical protein